MSTSVHVVQCSVCGHRMQIPPEYEGKAGRCSKCGTSLEPAPYLQVSLDASLIPPKTTSSQAPPAPSKSVVRVLLEGLAWGVAGSLATGTVLAVVFALAGVALGFSAASAAVIGIYIGFLLGGFTASTWRIIRDFELEALGGAVTGAIVGALAACVHFGFERLLFNLPENSLLLSVPIGIGAGLVFGGIVGYFNEE